MPDKTNRRNLIKRDQMQNDDLEASFHNKNLKLNRLSSTVSPVLHSSSNSKEATKNKPKRKEPEPSQEVQVTEKKQKISPNSSCRTMLNCSPHKAVNQNLSRSLRQVSSPVASPDQNYIHENFQSESRDIRQPKKLIKSDTLATCSEAIVSTSLLETLEANSASIAPEIMMDKVVSVPKISILTPQANPLLLPSNSGIHMHSDLAPSFALETDLWFDTAYVFGDYDNEVYTPKSPLQHIYKENTMVFHTEESNKSASEVVLDTNLATSKPDYADDRINTIIENKSSVSLQEIFEYDSSYTTYIDKLSASKTFDQRPTSLVQPNPCTMVEVLHSVSKEDEIKTFTDATGEPASSARFLKGKNQVAPIVKIPEPKHVSSSSEKIEKPTTKKLRPPTRKRKYPESLEQKNEVQDIFKVTKSKSITDELSQFPIPAFKNVRMLRSCPSGNPIITNLIFALNNGIYPPTVAGTSSDIINRNEHGIEDVKLTHEILIPDQIIELPKLSITTKLKPKKPVLTKKKESRRIETTKQPESKSEPTSNSNTPAILTLEQILKGISKR